MHFSTSNSTLDLNITTCLALGHRANIDSTHMDQELDPPAPVVP